MFAAELVSICRKLSIMKFRAIDVEPWLLYGSAAPTDV